MKLAIGIDVHKEKCAAHMVYAAVGEPRKPQFIEKFNADFRRFPSDYRGMNDLANRVRDHDVEILIENSTKSHDVFWMLTHLGLKVTVAHATDLYRITKSVTKNDDNDARELAGYMRRRMMGEDEFAVAHIPSREILEMRELCRMDLCDRSELSALKRRIHSHMLIRGWKLTRNYSNIVCRSALRELKNSMEPVLQLDAAKAEDLLERISFTEKLIRQKLCDNRTFDVVWSIPGFGVLTSAYVTCMIDDISRFENGRDFAASVGLTPKLDESADKGKRCGISRRGDPDLRRLMCQATFVHIRWTDGTIKRKYDRLKASGKHHNEALVACANSMARMVWSMIVDDRKFNAPKKVLTQARAEADSVDLEGKMEAAAEI
jgi:Transposase and inactivated derivatives